MCDNKYHEHWCSSCNKNLNKEPKDSYVEIEWAQNDSGQIIPDKKMLCNECLDKSENIKELNKFFSGLKYQPWNHIFCSSCKKDLTKEFGKDIKAGIDYECLDFKEHKMKKHFIRVVVLCNDCKKNRTYTEKLEELKKLGRNPAFKPKIECPAVNECKNFKRGNGQVNCQNIVIGRDRETLHIGLLCGRKHKGALPLPFDDGVSIVRPRKKGAALANPISLPTPSNPVSLPSIDIKQFANQMKEILKEINFEDIIDKRIKNIEPRIERIEKLLGLIPTPLTVILQSEEIKGNERNRRQNGGIVG